MVRGWLARKHFDDMLTAEDSDVKDKNKVIKDSKSGQMKVLFVIYV